MIILVNEHLVAKLLRLDNSTLGWTWHTTFFARLSRQRRGDNGGRLHGRRGHQLAAHNATMSGDSTCPDYHKCRNGGACAEDRDHEGTYWCDCSIIEGDRVFVGIGCEHEATNFCNVKGEVSRSSFCANEGTCKQLGATPDNEHAGCDCQPGYTGDVSADDEGEKDMDSLVYSLMPSVVLPHGGRPERPG